MRSSRGAGLGLALHTTVTQLKERIMSRPRSALLGVLVITACLLGVFANAAQAEGLYTGAEIEANEERFEGSLENSTGALLSELGSTKMDVVCITAQLVDALLNAAGGVKEGAKVK